MSYLLPMTKMQRSEDQESLIWQSSKQNTVRPENRSRQKKHEMQVSQHQ